MVDRECSESEHVTFEVEVSQPGIDPYWTFKNQPLKAGAKHKMESKNKRHSLTVINAMKDVEGQYTFAAGEKTCSAMLTVSGDNFPQSVIRLFELEKIFCTVKRKTTEASKAAGGKSGQEKNCLAGRNVDQMKKKHCTVTQIERHAKVYAHVCKVNKYI